MEKEPRTERRPPAGEGKPAAHALPERLFAWSVLLFVGAGVGLFLVSPGALPAAGGRGSTSALVHLLTLGGLLGGYYPLQAIAWRRLYGREPVLPILTWFVLGFHVTGVALLVWGFHAGSTLESYVGGHYLVPTGIVLFFGQGLATLARRPGGVPRHLAAHLPGFGLLVTMTLGALLVMDGHTGRYGIYTFQTILVHLLSGGFLFFLPMMLLQQSIEEENPTPESSGDDSDDASGAPPPAAAGLSPTARALPPLPGFSPTVRALPAAGLAGLGVLTVALAGDGGGQDWARPVGLLLLGAVALWIGLPAFGPRRRTSLKAVRRAAWGALGLLLLFAAIRAWRGMDAAQVQMLLGTAVLLFLFGVAVPEVLSRLAGEFLHPGAGAVGEAAERAVRARALQYTVLLLGAGLILAGQLAASPNLGRAGAILWLLCLGWQAGMMAGAVKRWARGE